MDHIEEIKNYCAPKLSNLSEEYTELYNKEIKDLQDWQAFGNLNMAKKLLDTKQQTSTPINSNNSGSLLLFLLDISSIDPIKSNITPDITALVAGSVPDIDSDFNPACREWVKSYIVENFGEEKTCSIGTYQKYKTRACIVDVARALGKDVHEIQDITKKISPLSNHENDEGEDEKIDDMDWEDIFEIYPELSNYMEQNPEVLRHCKVLRNQVKNMGKHAGGMIISNLNLQNKIPVVRDKSGQIVSVWVEGQNTQELSTNCGLIKFDLLGLSNLQVVSDCVALIEETRGIKLTREDIPIDDHNAIKFSSHNDLVGIFQFESPATKPLADAIQLDSIEDISSATSLLRPGPKDMGLHMEYAERKHGKEYHIPEFLRKCLDDTKGLLVYQETAMKIAQDLCGFSPVESNKLRSVISKKKKEEMPKMKEKFFKGAQKKIDSGEITIEEVQNIWDTLLSFCSYAFNRSHAIAYSALTASEFWLKHNYFTEYMCALIRNTSLSEEKHGYESMLVHYVNYCRGNNVKILPPDINMSKENFHIENDRTIRYGLDHIKMVANCAKLIIYPNKIPDENGIPIERVMRPYKDFHDFLGKINKSKVNCKIVTNLIYAGAFDEFGKKVLQDKGVTTFTIADIRNCIQKIYHDARNYKVVKEKKPVKIPSFTAEQYGKKEKTLREFSMNGFSTELFGNLKEFVEQVDKAVFTKTIITKMICKGMLDIWYIPEETDNEFKDMFNAYPIDIVRNGLLKQYYKILEKPKKEKIVEVAEQLTLEQYYEMEKEVLGLSLSRPIITVTHADLIRENKWCEIANLQYEEKEISMTIGRVLRIEAAISKSGKKMFRVYLTDEVNEIMFYVWQSDTNFFRSRIKPNNIYVFPLGRFEDSNTRFYSARGGKEAIEVHPKMLKKT